MLEFLKKYHLFLTLFLLMGLLTGCMQKNIEYKVLTLQDIEADMYGMLGKDGVAKPVPGQPGKLRITNVTLARSENIMPRILNKYGKDGWKLTSINSSQLYIFSRRGTDAVQYKVITLKALDAQIFGRLVKDKAAKAIPGQAGKFKILDVNKAKSQSIMPAVLGDMAKNGWALSGINKAQLYIFSKSGIGSIEANPLHLRSTQTKAVSKPATEPKRAIKEPVAKKEDAKEVKKVKAETDKPAKKDESKTAKKDDAKSDKKSKDESKTAKKDNAKSDKKSKDESKTAKKDDAKSDKKSKDESKTAKKDDAKSDKKSKDESKTAKKDDAKSDKKSKDESKTAKKDDAKSDKKSKDESKTAKKDDKSDKEEKSETK